MSREVLKEVVQGGPQEVAKGDVAKGRLKRRKRDMPSTPTLEASTAGVHRPKKRGVPSNGCFSKKPCRLEAQSKTNCA